jgi:hypothetical protein
MAISYSSEGYKVTPQFANLGALQGLQPLDVTRKATFEPRPLAPIEVYSSRPELVAQGLAQGIQSAVSGVTEGIKAHYSEKKELAKEERKFQQQVALEKEKRKTDDADFYDKELFKFDAQNAGKADYQENRSKIVSLIEERKASIPRGALKIQTSENKAEDKRIIDAEKPLSEQGMSVDDQGRVITNSVLLPDETIPTGNQPLQGTPEQRAAQEEEARRYETPSETYAGVPDSVVAQDKELLNKLQSEEAKVQIDPVLAGIVPPESTQQPVQPKVLSAMKPAIEQAVDSVPPKVDTKQLPKPDYPTGRLTTQQAQEVIKNTPTNAHWELSIKPLDGGWNIIEPVSKFKEITSEQRARRSDWFKEKQDVRAENKAALEEQIKGLKIPEPLAPLKDQIETSATTVRDINQVLEILKENPGAVGKMSSYQAKLNPFQNDASTVRGLMNSIYSNVALGALINMRKASPTGAAVGNVTEKEMDLFKAAEGALDVDQLPSDIIIERLERIKDERVKEINKASINIKQFDNSYEIPKFKFEKPKKSGSIKGKMVNVIRPDGKTGTIPESQLQEAISQGFKLQ